MITSPAQTFRTLANFNGTDGAAPSGPLVQGLDGNFYGTTGGGGAYSRGTVFKVTRSGVLTTLYSFCVAQWPCSDGNLPADILQATDGNFYGTTVSGGTHGEGTVFKITPSGNLTALYSFCAKTGCTDGDGPEGSLIQATDGNFYGTTFQGGQLGDPFGGTDGSVFKITPSGELTVLHRFDWTDGAHPLAGLVQGTDGNFYGTTQSGGAYGSSCAGFGGCGTVFKITPSGAFTSLHRFDLTDGAYTDARLVQGTDGNFYGTTFNGGNPNPVCNTQQDLTRCGTVFRITPNGTLTTLHSFNGTDGYAPGAELVQATDGNFYGTTSHGGAYGNGTIFKITPVGALTTLHSFNGTDGSSPWAELVQATNGTLYGTTLGGGIYGRGTIFSLCVGLGWFVETLPTTGTVGATIQILGTDFTGATAVTFNGTPAPFTIISRTQIQATVPTGSTTGSVKVTIPSGTPTSNKRFRVLPQMTSFSPTSGPAGTVVTITGVSLAQTTRIGIGGVSASFTVVDDTTVTATVPTGATTGKKVVITARGGNVASATTFTVTE